MMVVPYIVSSSGVVAARTCRHCSMRWLVQARVSWVFPAVIRLLTHRGTTSMLSPGLARPAAARCVRSGRSDRCATPDVLARVEAESRGSAQPVRGTRLGIEAPPNGCSDELTAWASVLSGE
jgi:hypothetical protein